MSDGLGVPVWHRLQHSQGFAGDVPELLDVLDRAVARRDALIADWDLSALVCHGGSAVEEATPYVVREFVSRLETDGFRWKVELLAHLAVFGECLGAYRHLLRSNPSGSVLEEVGWEDQVAEQLLAGVGVFRKLLGDPDPEVRSMAASALAASTSEPTSDGMLLARHFDRESHELARACIGGARAVMAMMKGDPGGVVRTWVLTVFGSEDQLLRLRIARDLINIRHWKLKDEELEAMADSVSQTASPQLTTRWKAEIG